MTWKLCLLTWVGGQQREMAAKTYQSAGEIKERRQVKDNIRELPVAVNISLEI